MSTRKDLTVAAVLCWYCQVKWYPRHYTLFKIAKYCIRYSVSVKLFDDNIICWGRYWTSTGQQQFHECGRVTNMADIDLSYTKNGSHCELCDVSFTSMSHCRQHCDGRKHKNKLCDRRIAGKSKRLMSVRVFVVTSSPAPIARYGCRWYIVCTTQPAHPFNIGRFKQ